MLKASSSTAVFPMSSAPASIKAWTVGEVVSASPWVRSHSGLPAPVTNPATSNRSLAPKVSPASGPLGAPGTFTSA
ncbi:MAG TPA: hypothetical protein QGG32_00315 [Rhodospirillales bacterium]|jgi:hypothetical protein|nr:hypothetical protein [Rhodospirillales bacterium]